VLGVSSLASAQFAPSSVSGKIASVDPVQQRISLRTWLFFTRAFDVKSGAKISDGRRSLQLDELKPGAQATAEYTRRTAGRSRRRSRWNRQRP
jgi:hypothetical protein